MATFSKTDDAHAAREEPWRAIVAASLDWKEAHDTLDDAVKGLDPALRGIRPQGLVHSPWELLEHIRRTQADLVHFMEDPDYTAPEWPRDYWPSSAEPPSPTAWDDALGAIRGDRERIRALTMRQDVDLAAPIPWGDGQTFLRTVLLSTLHASYHIAQIIDARRLLGAWHP